MRLYDGTHPFVQSAIAQAADALHEALQATGTVTLGVTIDGFLIGGASLPGSAPLGMLAAELHRNNIALIEFHSASPQALATFARSIAVPDEAEGRDPEQLVARLNTLLDGQIRLQSLRADGLRLTDQRIDPSRGTRHSETRWASLIANLLNPAAGDIDPGELAAQANACAHQLSVDELRAVRARIAAAAAHEDEPDNVHTASPVQQRLQGFVGSLTPRLRQSLLALNPGDNSTDVASFVDAASVFPVEDVVTALELANRGRGNPAQEVIQMFRKLQQVLSSQAATRGLGGRLDAAIGDLVEPARRTDVEACEAADDISESVAELLTTRGEANYSPDDYRQNINDLIEAAPIADDSAIARSAITQDRLAMHAAEIAAHLLACDEPSRRKPGAYRCITANLKLITNHSLLDLIPPVLEAAHTLKAAQVSDETFEAASEVIRLTREHAFIEQLTLLADDHAELHRETITDLLRSGGSATVEILLRSASTSPPWQRDLTSELLGGMTDDDIITLLTDSSADRDGARAVAAPLLAALPAARRSDIALQLVCSDAPGVRESLDLIGEAVNWTPDALRLLLRHNASHLQSHALSIIEQQPDLNDGGELIDYLLGRNCTPADAPFERAAWMIASNESGARQIASALDAARTGEIAITGPHGERVIKTMTKYVENPDIGAAVRRWNRSLRRRIGGLTKLLGGGGRDAA